MSIREVANDVGATLRSVGLHTKFEVRSGTWSEPATVKTNIGGQERVIQLWEGDDKRAAKALLKDCLSDFGRDDLIPKLIA